MPRFRIEYPWAASIGGAILHDYGSFALVHAASEPRDLPAGVWEACDDPTVLVNGEPVTVPEGALPQVASPRRIVRFIGPVAPAWRRRLDQAGVRVVAWCPPYGAVLQLPDGMADEELLSWSCIAGIVALTGEHCRRREPDDALAVPHDWYDVICFSREDRARLETRLAELGIAVLAAGSSKLRVRYDGDPARIRDMVGVKLLQRSRRPGLAGAPMAAALAAADAAGDWQGTWDGGGELIAVADTGLDASHPDFADRIEAVLSWPIDASWNGYVQHEGHDDGGGDVNSGHGTHVAGLACGSGAAGGARGVAPGARLLVQAIEQYTEMLPEWEDEIPSAYYLSGRPLDLRELFRQARDAGARIHVNAWGDPARGVYTDDCFEADLFLHQHQDAVICYASGNEGCDKDGDRVVDAGRVDAPAAAKNVLAVGATEGPVQGVGFRGTWGELDGDRRLFRSSADEDDHVSGEPDVLALFSAAGPTADGRIKPDLCAPGTNVAAARSQSISGQGWGLANPLPKYMYNGGTSMSTGVVGGVLATVRQAWRDRLGRPPGGPALKALLAFGAAPVRARGGGVEARRAAGFGRVQVAASLPQATTRLIEDSDGLATGAVSDRALHHGGGAFRAVLCWYDAPGEALVNDLDLLLLREDGSRICGNHPDGGDGTPDRINSIEVIEVADLPAGTYTLRVSGANVPQGPQAFALVWRGAADGGTTTDAPSTDGASAGEDGGGTQSASESASPPRLDCPLAGRGVAVLLGIGATRSRRLADGGIADLAALIRATPDAVAQASQLTGLYLARLLGQRRILAAVLAAPLPAQGDPQRSLADLLGDDPDLSLREGLAPLLSILDRAAWRGLTLGDLIPPT